MLGIFYNVIQNKKRGIFYNEKGEKKILKRGRG